MKSCFVSRREMTVKGYSQQLQFIQDCELFIILFNFSCRAFNFSLKLYAIIKIRAKLKIAQLANFPLLPRRLAVCLDSSNLQEDKSSSGCDLWCCN